MNIKGLDKPELFLNAIAESLRNVERWKNYPLHTKESVLDHTFKFSTLGLMACLMEQEKGQTDIDFFKVMAAIQVHDWSEGLTGDITWTVKNDPRIREILEEIEKEKLTAFLATYLPEALIKTIDCLVEVQHEASPTGRFFRGLEILGYISYALHEIEECGHREFIAGVLEKQHHAIEEYASQFSSIKTFWLNMKPRVDIFLNENKSSQ